ncbi:alpha/beta hydrolase [Streptomyces orinoci]|uniref:Alpha/beta hydrolase n=1 Tax=Streptomyces orinoci TaxID=67339 RepID=A0ABV3JWD7_STRON|nr:alpha/beta hydrolase [Streptomyces orinoci]
MRPTRSLSALALTLILTAAGCGGSTPASPDRTDDDRPPAIGWKPCGAPTAAQGGGRAPGADWECGTLRAPLDYTKPHGDTIGIALIRAKATDRAHRIGSLIFNFGGPGGSGVAALPQFAPGYRALRARYDLVSFDPRGVGESAGVRCLDDKALDEAAQTDNTPENDTELHRTQQQNAAYAAACAHNSGRLLGQVDTTSAARDMDRLRQALGDDKLHYFGISYGTELGGVYAHLFPRRVGRAVLDAVVDPTQDPLQGTLGQTKGFQLALDDYLKDCPGQCPRQTEITALLDRLHQDPLPTEQQGRVLTRDEAVNGIAAALYSKDTWRYLSLGLREAMSKGTGSVLLSLSDSLAGREPDGHYSNLQAANRAISCVDAQQRYSAGQVRAQLPAFRAASAVFGESAAWSLLDCTGWPVPGKWRTPQVSAPGAAPILVIGNTGDPATPYEGAGRMARQLGKDVGVLVTYRGEGHGAYNSGNPCMTALVNSYLLNGTPPRPGTTCAP